MSRTAGADRTTVDAPRQAAAAPARDAGARYPYVLGLIYAVFWAALAVHPNDRMDWLLENLLVVFVVVPLLVIQHRRCPLSMTSYSCIFVFMILHTIGSHYTYAEVPLGYALQEWAGLSRNHYDRVIHFAFGLLINIPMLEAQSRWVIPRPLSPYVVAAATTFCFSGLYELLEWGVACVVAPEAGNAYLGTQGDPFDAQKDMALALLGGVLSMSYAWAADRLGHPVHRSRCAVRVPGA